MQVRNGHVLAHSYRVFLTKRVAQNVRTDVPLNMHDVENMVEVESGI